MHNYGPDVSIVLPVHNEVSYIGATLDSILRQTFNNFEVIIIDDASKDGTGVILNNYAQIDSRIKIICNPNTMGVAGAANRGIEASMGKYIARIDAGDTCSPYRLQKQFDYLEKNNDIMVVGSWVYIINKEGMVIGKWITSLEVNRKNIYKKNGIIQPSVMMRRTIFDLIGGKYNSHLKVAEDFELWIRIIKRGFKITNIPDFLTSIVEREEGLTSKYFMPMQVNVFKIKLRYLPYFFSLQNCVYTLRSLLGIILCFLFLRRLVMLLSANINLKAYNE